MVTATAASWWIWNHPTWSQAEIWAVVILLLPSFVCLVANQLFHKQWHFCSRLVTGEDGRWSTSKAGYLLWTYAFLFAGLATLIEAHHTDAFFGGLRVEYLVVLGIPAAAAFGAKAIANNAGESAGGSADAQTNVGAGIGQLVTDDDGDTALHKFQYLAFNLLLLGFFLVRFLGAEADGLPDLPDTFVGLTGVSAAAYLAQKGLSTSTAGAPDATPGSSG